MPDFTIPTDEEAKQMRERLAAYQQQKDYEIALARHAVYEAVLPIVNSEEFVSIHEQIAALRENGPHDDTFFSLGIDAIYNGMSNLGVQCAIWSAPVPPVVEGTSDNSGE